ncbi:Pleckstrin homology domain-containing family G member 1 [Halotydeus destructor]|nr:Pleckstrin homology domain-containing family G member 1 [Halotydeus destructor]
METRGSCRAVYAGLRWHVHHGSKGPSSILSNNNSCEGAYQRYSALRKTTKQLAVPVISKCDQDRSPTRSPGPVVIVRQEEKPAGHETSSDHHRSHHHHQHHQSHHQSNHVKQPVQHNGGRHHNQINPALRDSYEGSDYSDDDGTLRPVEKKSPSHAVHDNGHHCHQDLLTMTATAPPSASLTTSGASSAAQLSPPASSNNMATTMTNRISKLDRIVQEIVDTERSYVNDLREIIEGYLQPVTCGLINGNTMSPKSRSGSMKSELRLRLSTIQQVLNVFSNIEDVYQFNSSLLSQLEKCQQNPVDIAHVFVNNSAGFNVYTQYCTNYSRAVSLLTDLMKKKEMAEMFRERMVTLKHNLPLSSYLLKPVQRILKYHLLLQSLLHQMDSDTKGYEEVKKSLNAMVDIACHINDMQRLQDHGVRQQEMHSLLYRCVKWLLLKIRN